MKHILIIIIFTASFSFSGLGIETQMLLNDEVSINKTALKISQNQLDKLYQLSSYGINLIKDNYLNHHSFLPVIFSYSDKKKSKIIEYDDPGIKDTIMTDFVHERLMGITDKELEKENIRIVCIVYMGKIKNAKYPNSIKCISLLFISKGFDNSVIDNFPVRIENGKLIFEDVVVQIVKK
jgi:hypothetical protein